MSSKRKNIPIKLSPTLPHYMNDKGLFKPADNIDPFPCEAKPEVDSENNLKRPADSSSNIGDPQMSPPVSKKSRRPSASSSDGTIVTSPRSTPRVEGGRSGRGGDVLDTMRRAVMGGSTSVSEKQKQISQMIAELQSLQHNLTTSNTTSTSEVPTLFFSLLTNHLVSVHSVTHVYFRPTCHGWQLAV